MTRIRMVTARILCMCLVVSLSLLQSEAISQIHNLSQCDQFGVERCMEEKRMCRLHEDGRETCGPCELGYIDIIVDGGQESVAIDYFCIEVADLTWDRFTAAVNPFYASVTDATVRLALLIESAVMISEHNALDRSLPYTLGLTPYSADTEVEYIERSGYFFVNVSGTEEELPSFNPMTWATADIPKTVDWVAVGAVTPVKDQGRCASSWAIGVCGAIEGAAFVSDGLNQSVSFQQLVSCNKRNLGCEGGSTAIAASYTVNNWFGGVAALGDYPYMDADGITTELCRLTRESPPLAVEVTDVVRVAGLDEAMSFEERLGLFKLALLEKPVSVIMKSSCVLFSNYRSGILTDDGDCACSDSSCMDHSVLMVGYNDTGNTPYFTLKNSWGTKWGEDGYFRVAQIGTGDFGLFGIFAEGFMVRAEQSVEPEVSEVAKRKFPVWGIVLISLSPLLLLCCFCESKPVRLF